MRSCTELDQCKLVPSTSVAAQPRRAAASSSEQQRAASSEQQQRRQSSAAQPPRAAHRSLPPAPLPAMKRVKSERPPAGQAAKKRKPDPDREAFFAEKNAERANETAAERQARLQRRRAREPLQQRIARGAAGLAKQMRALPDDQLKRTETGLEPPVALAVLYVVNPSAGRLRTRVPPAFVSAGSHSLASLGFWAAEGARPGARPRMGTGGTRPAPGGPWASSAQQTAGG
eukprot:COSAG04_NODE_77_length_28411_cov_8.599181_2_plen_230_part_00